jgi:hypothetical protein
VLSVLVTVIGLLLGQSVTPTCAQVDSRLIQLTQAPDPAAFAASAGLDYDDAGVLAIIELVGDDEPDPMAYGLTEEARYANLLQARVPVDQLCLVAADAAVANVRPPAGRAPAGVGASMSKTTSG